MRSLRSTAILADPLRTSEAGRIFPRSWNASACSTWGLAYCDLVRATKA